MKQVSSNFFLSLFLTLGIFAANIASAVCPVCVVAVGAGLGLSRWLGIDDIISGIWIGALLISVSLWTHDWIVKKGWGFKYSVYVIGAAYYLLTFVPLFTYEVLGHPLNKIFGIDKLLFGTVIGTIFFIASVWLHEFLKSKNNGKSYFPYQKVVAPVAVLIILSLITWMII